MNYSLKAFGLALVPLIATLSCKSTGGGLSKTLSDLDAESDEFRFEREDFKDITNTLDDGTQEFQNGSRILADGTKVSANGSELRKDGTMVSPSGHMTFPDGVRIFVDQYKSPKKIIRPDGAIQQTVDYSNLPVTGEYQLPEKKSETLFIHNPEGKSVLVLLEKEAKKIAEISVPIKFKNDPEVFQIPNIATRVSSVRGRFYILNDGRISIINGRSGALEKTLHAPLAQGFLAQDETTGFAFLDGEIKEYDLTKGLFRRTVKYKAEGWALAGPYLLAATTSELVVIDRESFKIVKTFPFADAIAKRNEQTKIENEKLGRRNKPLSPIAPVLNVSWDQETNIAQVTSSSITSRSAGAYFTIDLIKGEVAAFYGETFGGSRYFLPKTDRSIVLQHTATPTASTHVILKYLGTSAHGKTVSSVFETKKGEKETRRLVNVNDKYELMLNRGPIFDLFVVENNLQHNVEQSLVALSNSCLTGVCTAGKGVILYDIKNDKRLPNITSDFLGFVPGDAFFLNP